MGTEMEGKRRKGQGREGVKAERKGGREKGWEEM